VVALVGGFLPLDQIAELSNAGTLLAFICVAVCLMVLRVRGPTCRGCSAARRSGWSGRWRWSAASIS
jgi:amino acid transporter